jgi:hypothetical protein
VEIDFGSLRGGFVWKWATKSLSATKWG